MVFLGEELVIKGTGRRWSGVNFNVTVVDIRESDNTVKVQYASDGGYKRFAADKFDKLIIKDRSVYKFDAYELGADSYDPTMEAITASSELRQKLHDAVKAHDFIKADQLKQELESVFREAEALNQLRAKLVTAVQSEDFKEAHKIELAIKDLEAGNVKQPTATGEVDFGEVLAKAKKRALGGGMAGALAMFLQVGSLMWMRTTMNYQYRHGTTTREALKKLYADGGIRRFYRGVGPALIQGPMSRFGDTAANTGTLTLLNSLPSTQGLPMGVKTVAASSAAASWRIFLMPVDTLKTNLQVEGNLTHIAAKFKKSGPLVLWHGSLAACSATFAGHLPWFGTYNFLNSKIPEFEGKMATLGRNAVMGFCASVVSDTTSNSIRVVKTYRQTSEVSVSYVQSAKNIIASDGLAGLFGRGLQTRILANGMQGVMFSVLWKYFDKYVFNAAK